MDNSSLPRQILDWVAVLERLGADHRASLARHFLSLGPDDRRLRFGMPVSDAHIQRYVDGLDFSRDVVFGVRAEADHWIGLGHLVLGGDTAELGLSVLPEARGHGLGAAIFRFAVAHAARAGAGRLYMHYLSSNRAIVSIARRAGMSMSSEAGEGDAYLIVPPYPEFVRMLIDEPDAEPPPVPAGPAQMRTTATH